MTENQLKYLSLQETARHNEAMENVDSAELQEKIRSNQVKEAETHRANVAHETETQRANIAEEKLGGDANAIKLQQHYESVRSNMAREAETHRTNTELEALRRQENTLKFVQAMAGPATAAANAAVSIGSMMGGFPIFPL